MRIIRFFLRPVFAALIAAAGPLTAAPLSDPAVDAYNMRVGTETFAALYKFTPNTALVETAQAITNLGSDTIKLYLGSDTSYQAGVPLPSNVTNLLTLVRDEPNYHQVLDMPFRHFVMWAYPLENSDEWWGNGYNNTAGGKDYQEMYNLTHYLLTNYNNSGKTFYLGHWEGDGYLQVNGSWSVTNPGPQTLQGMIGWLNNRQKAVDDAKAATACTNVYVYNYAECNRVQDAMHNGANDNQRVINYVVPYVTNLDYLSYSSYDSQNLSASDLYTTLNYMQSMLPTNKAAVVPGCRMWVGEYGWGYESLVAQEPVNRAYIQRLLGWSANGQCLPFLLFWEMYSNYNPNGATNFCLVDYTNNKVPSWYLQHYFFNSARLLTAQFKEINGRLPTDTEFSAMTMPLLNQPLIAPVPLAVTNAGATLLTSTSATVSATLAQGIYGDSKAGVWVYYGRHDGGTSIGSWENARFLGNNTNFNPATFSVTLSGLVPQTNYFFRYYAANATTNAWAQMASQFSTLTLNPSSFGSQLRVFFSGYNRGEKLTNFPALVNLSTNLPGFSYRQFASPTGGDLRFTDAGGIMPIPFEIDEWNTNGVSSVWVNVPFIVSTNDSIWAYWGNPLATNLPASSTNGGAWSNFDLVWHLKENGFPYADSTLQFPVLSGFAPAQTSGVIGHGETFNGSTTFLNAGAVTDLNNAFSLSAWVNISPSANNIQTVWANQKGGFGSAGFALFVNAYNTTNGAVLLDAGDGASGSEISTPAGAVSFGQWHLVTAAIDRADGKATFFVDGAPAGTGSIVTDFLNNAVLNFGRFTNSTLYFKGALDEARIQSGIQSSNWVWASWATVASNSTLESYSTVTQQPPALNLGISGTSGTQLSWPSSGVGFALYTTTNLSSQGTWTLASSQPLFTNGQWQISLPSVSNAMCFYRLESQ